MSSPSNPQTSRSVPVFSIIIPTRDRPAALVRCLESVADLDYPRDCFEVVVVDDGSRELPEAEVRPFRSRISIRLVWQENAGPAAARNLGAAAATGEWLAFLDDDCRPTRGWLRTLAEQALASSDALGGTTVNGLPENRYSSASQLLVDFVCDWLLLSRDSLRFFPSNNLAVPADPFRRLGGFSPEFPQAAAEDRDFCRRWIESGAALQKAPEAIVQHYHDMRAYTFWRQQFHYGRGAFIFHRLRKKTTGKRFQLPQRDFYYGLLRRSWSVGPHGFYTCALIVLSQLANLTGFCFQGFLAGLGVNSRTVGARSVQERP